MILLIFGICILMVIGGSILYDSFRASSSFSSATLPARYTQPYFYKCPHSMNFDDKLREAKKLRKEMEK